MSHHSFLVVFSFPLFLSIFKHSSKGRSRVFLSPVDELGRSLRPLYHRYLALCHRAEHVSLEDAKGALGVSVSYCKALSAAILNGDVDRIELWPYSGESDAIEALNYGTVDVVAGAEAQMQYDLGGPGVPGVYFTTPYLYGSEAASEGVTMVTMATREDDEMFCSFVNLVVLAPSHAQVMGISRQRTMTCH